MCTAYELGKRGATFPDRVNARASKELLKITGTRLIRPTLAAPVITANGDLETMRWGFHRPFSHAIVNARQDKLHSAMWRKALTENRCLIPVSAYYEWSGPTGRKRTHRFSHTADEWLWIAGIWEENTEFGPCFSMITTTANSRAAGIHNRMPAVLRPHELSPFLDDSLAEFHPDPDTLQVADAPNPLRAKPEPPAQGELF